MLPVRWYQLNKEKGANHNIIKEANNARITTATSARRQRARDVCTTAVVLYTKSSTVSTCLKHFFIITTCMIILMPKMKYLVV